MSDKSQSVSRLLEALARAGPTAESKGRRATSLDDGTLWAFLDGELAEEQEEAVYQSVTENPDLTARLLAILDARRKVASEEAWNSDRIAAMIAERTRTQTRTRVDRGEPSPSTQEAPFVGQIVRLGRQAMELLSIGPGLMRPALALAPVRVRSDPGAEQQAPSAVRWTRMAEGVQLNLTIEPARPPNTPARLFVETVGLIASEGCQLELMAEDDILLELVSVDALPDRLDLPPGRCRLNLVTPTRTASLLEWDLSDVQDRLRQ